MSKFNNNAITWFEIPTTDFERATTFYETILDTRLRSFPGPEPCNMFPTGENGVGGCLVHRPQHKPTDNGTLIYLNVDGKLDEVVGRAQQHGGTLLVPRTAIGGNLGSYAVLTDSEGNHIGLHTR